MLTLAAALFQRLIRIMMKLQIIAVSLLALTLSACSEQEIPTQDKAQQTKEALPLGDTSRT